MTSWLSSAQHVRVDTGFGALPCAVSSDPVDGPAVFLVHGRNGAAVQPQMSALAEAYLRRGWAVVAPDLPFSVASPDLGAPEQATMAHHVAAATAVFDALLARRDGTAPLALCGHSLGAFAIARLARSRGGLHHLCAVSPVLSGQHLLAARAAMGGDALAVLEQEVPQMYASMAEESCALDLAATRTPVAVMTGTRDGITPPDHARAYFAACRNGRFFSVLPGLHHCPDGPGSGTRDGGGLGRRLHHERPEPMEAWIARRRAGALRALRGAISATHLTHERVGFGWCLCPAAGSVLASPRRAAWDPEPDYFHHWVRDAAVVMRVLPEILADAAPQDAAWWRRAFADHVTFSLAISDPHTPPLQANPLRGTTAADHQRFLRPDAELQTLSGIARLGEPRFAADGSVDLERWSRPQDDGPALRAATVMAICAALPDLASKDTARLIQRDLAYTAQVAGRASVGPWEEEPARHHSYTLIVQWDALDRGAGWLEARGVAPGEIAPLRAAAERVLNLLAQTAAPAPVMAWTDAIGAPPDGFDSATVLAILHAGRRQGPLACSAPRSLGTVAALMAQFGALYPLNAGRTVPAMGRSVGDVFFGGNPWLPVTLGFAELHYEIAAQAGDRAAFEKAEDWMSLLREVLPEGDALPEQIDRATGQPVSCLELSWSAAAFLGAAAARARAAQVIEVGAGDK